MTIEEAIRVLEHGGWWDLLDEDGSDADLDPLEEAMGVALDALRAQQSRTMGGGEYCKDIPESIPKGFCYACGHSLAEEAEAALKKRGGLTRDQRRSN